MEKTVNFVFIDESLTEEIDLASLTGLVVPFNKFENIRTDFYIILDDILDTLYPDMSNKKRIYYPPVLHAKSFLRNSNDNENIDFDFSNISDEYRILILNKIVKIVSDYDLFVIRVGYSNYREMKKKLNDDKLHNTNWFSLSRTLDLIFQDCILIPVMEGIDSNLVGKFSNILWSTNWKRELYPKLANSMTYKNSKNFYGSVFFTQSKFTECIQIVDIISYLLQKEDFINLKASSSNYSKMMVSTLSHLKKENLINSINKMEFID